MPLNALKIACVARTLPTQYQTFPFKQIEPQGLKRFFAAPGVESQIMKTETPDLIILCDVSSGGGDLDYLLYIFRRLNRLKVPVIFCSRELETEHVSMCLDQGIDDCLFGNFSNRELTSKLKALIRRRDFNRLG